MADGSYAYAKSAQAAKCLTARKGTINERLVEACNGGFGLVQVAREVLSEDLKTVDDQVRDLVEGERHPTHGESIRNAHLS